MGPGSMSGILLCFSFESGVVSWEGSLSFSRTIPALDLLHWRLQFTLASSCPVLLGFILDTDDDDATED